MNDLEIEISGGTRSGKTKLFHDVCDMLESQGGRILLWNRDGTSESAVVRVNDNVVTLKTKHIKIRKEKTIDNATTAQLPA